MHLAIFEEVSQKKLYIIRMSILFMCVLEMVGLIAKLYEFE